MIGFLTGQPQVLGRQLLLLVGGVGYLVEVGPQTLSLATTQSTLSLFIHTHFKQDALELFGFLTQTEYQVFQLLLKVGGVGPKTAVAIVDGRAQEVAKAVQEADTSFFTTAPRVGKKLAQKIIIELRSKLGEVKQLDLTPSSAKKQEVVAALSSLGLDERSIDKALSAIDVDNEELTVESAITLALKQL